MNYYSTNRQSPVVDFREATIKGQAPDKGLYFPGSIPDMDPSLIKNIENMPNEEIAFRVIRPYVGSTMSEDQLYNIACETVNFPMPLVPVHEKVYSLELFHGPTLAFKDVGARFMSRCLGQFVKNREGKVTVLVATSGDTGGAVANGFYEVDGVEVVILYPSGMVSPVQEKQLTTLGKNIHALEVQGTFDDCQQMVKQAFADEDINNSIFLTSANSINVARWLPQQFYYLFAFKQWGDKHKPPVISVPSGNFGNICAGMLAMKSGLPVKHFIAACNVNDVISLYLQTQELKPKQAVATFSNAMDVGNPSNFVRIQEIFRHQFPELKRMLSSATVTDEAVLQTIQDLYRQTGYLTDPHGAVGYLALQRFLEANKSEKGIFLETAHPVKFPGPVFSATGVEVPWPDSLDGLMQTAKKSMLIPADFNYLKAYLLDTR